MLVFVASSLAKRGHTVSIANLNRVPEYVNEHRRNIDDSITVYEKKDGSRSVKSDLNFLTKTAKAVKPQIIIGFTGYPNMYAKILGGLCGVPSIMSERGDPSRTSGTTLKARIANFIINRSRGGVFQTEGARDYYGKGLRKRGIVIPNPIFIEGDVPFVPYKEREKSIVSVGRLDNYQKRYDVMLDAFKLFSEEHPDYVLKLYGTGADVETINEWVDERGLSDKVKFMGLSKSPMKDICRDGMFLITSDYEGISNALLEAMAIGLPCVSTDHTPGGARLLIQDHENGLLAPVGDASALAVALCEFAENSSLAAKCGENARDVVNRFAPDRIIDMWEEYIVNIEK